MSGKGRRAYSVPSVAWKIHIYGDVAAELELLLADPLTGQIKKGARSQLINRLLREWLQERKKTVDNSDS